MEKMVINGMEYFDPDEKKIYGVKVIFRSNIIEVFKNSSEIIFIHEEISSAENYIEPTTYELSYGRQGIYFYGFSVTTTEPEQTQKILNYYNKYNEEVKERRLIKKRMVNEIVSEIEAEVNPMSLNLISMLPDVFFMQSDMIVFINRVWSYEDYDITTGDTDFDEIRELIHIIMEKFNEYCLILIEEYNLQESIANQVAWKLGLNASKEYFAQKFIEELVTFMGVNIADVSSVDEFIDIYCNCPEINSLVIENISLLTYYLMYYEAFDDNSFFPICYRDLSAIIANRMDTIKRKRVANAIRGIHKVSVAEETYTIYDVDMMDGNEFEHFVCKMYSKMGYKAEVTKQTGDQGLDVIAEKGGKKFGIQAKCYSSVVGNSAIQEAVAGQKYYDCDKVIVVTNNSFTNSAIELAQVNNVILWDRNILKEKISELF